MKKLYMLIALLLCCCLYVSAQNVTLNGIVTDSQNLPLPGVTVKVTGTSKATVTDYDGKFTLAAPANSSLLFSFIGYVSQTINMAGKTNITVLLQSDKMLLETVTVTALGIT
ncbi:MAG: SusC/RagA family TonB-linked outer membrane protein, partial [Mucilaginibacter sp.]|nr:SusC/RagA family TonB-linked outer membrane protein [Mucilaginibacter sp.]